VTCIDFKTGAASGDSSHEEKSGEACEPCFTSKASNTFAHPDKRKNPYPHAEVPKKGVSFSGIFFGGPAIRALADP
jgi:hypothetical protein